MSPLFHPARYRYPEQRPKTLISDAEDITYAYDWRIQQEHGLIASRGSGMTNDQVTEFVDGCTTPISLPHMVIDRFCRYARLRTLCGFLAARSIRERRQTIEGDH